MSKPLRSRKRNRKRTKAGLQKKKIYRPLTRSRLKKTRIHLAVFARDEWKCRICGKTKVTFNAHHLIPWAQEKRLRADFNNLLTVCEDCHLNKCHLGDFYCLDRDLSGRLLLENIKKGSTIKNRAVYISFFEDWGLTEIVEELKKVKPSYKDKKKR